MKKLIISAVLSIVALSNVTAQSGIYSIQLAAFDTPVDIPNYFLGIENVTHIKDQNSIHRYLVMGIYDLNEAKAKKEEFKKAGFKPSILNHSELLEKCNVICDKSQLERDEEEARLKWIFFGYDQANLVETSRYQLDNLHNILKTNPNYTAELSAFADSKGTEQYNWLLSKRRANNVVSFLTQRGVKRSRLVININGESNPIAKNVLVDGTDCVMGRQLNRRVEIKIFDGYGNPLSLVDLPQIPKEIQ